MTKKLRGFTLLEILITLSVIAILMKLGTESYSAYTLRAQRLRAEVELAGAATQLENYFTSHKTYAGATYHPSPSPSQKNYQIKIIEATDNNYQLAAIPLHEDKDCGTLMLTSSGEKKISGSNNVIECWI